MLAANWERRRSSICWDRCRTRPGAPFQLLGVGRPELRPLVAEALLLLGTERALVVCGEDGLDEVTLAGATRVTEVRGGQLREFTWHPRDFGIPTASMAELRISGPDESAATIRGVLAGEPGRCATSWC